jgi:Fungal specific transcription factor domain
VSPGSGGYGGGSGSAYAGTPSQGEPDPRSNVDMPIYDQNDPSPVSKLILHLVETFFAHLGCNYPFLRPKSFMQRVEEKSVEPILVDAVCGLAARFSDHPLLVNGHGSQYLKSEYGQVFAQRAKAAVVDTFPCPSVAAVQACLLLAYEGFGANQDSALWMYLGCAIRMAVDLGLQKLDGVKHQGEKDPGYRRLSNDFADSDPPAKITAQERKEVEQERIDTLWAVFMLDRVISSGTGRPVTLRDEDLELSFPTVTFNPQNGWPKPFPALIQIIHLYGRVSDLLNNIRDVKDVTPNKVEGLSEMEKDLTQFYEELDDRLTFNATNFQHYVRSGEGTNFILVCRVLQ